MPDETPTVVELPPIVPVFPLPNTVLFPRTLLPLHIFEPRYRAMVRDIQEGSGLVAIARMVGEGFDRLGTVGRLRDVESLEDGRFNIVVEGLQRTSMIEIDRDTPYRQVSIEPRPERPGTDDPSAIEKARLDLLASLSLLLSVARSSVPVVLNEDLPFEVVVNKASAGLPVEAAARQRLLEEDDLLERYRLLAVYLDSVIESVAQSKIGDSGGGSAPN